MTKQFLSVIVFVLLCFFSKQSISQDDNWKIGRVMFKKKSDTLNGFLKVQQFASGNVKKVWFRENKDVKKGTLKIGGISYLKKDTLLYFDFGNNRYKYIDYEDESFPTKRFTLKNALIGWVEIITEGAIDVYKGFAVYERVDIGFPAVLTDGSALGIGTSGGTTTIPTYCLKRDFAPMILIAAPPIVVFEKNYMLYEVDDKNKAHFISYIDAYTELAEKIQKMKLTFGDIENIVREYNEWAKNNNTQ